MEIVIIGSGNVATHLIKAFQENNINIKQLYGRNSSDLEHLSKTFSIPYSTTTLEKADLYLISVSDRAVEDVSKLITYSDCLVAHTSGSLPVDILQGDYRKASFYPLQTFSKTKDLDYKKIPFFIETEERRDEIYLLELAKKISENVMISTFEKRKYIHLTAVFSCNFVNHLFTRAKEISDKQEIPFEYFLPLIDETVEKIHSVDPKEAQTGPAVRNDVRILELHENLIDDAEHLKIYQTLNNSIKKMYNL